MFPAWRQSNPVDGSPCIMGMEAGRAGIERRPPMGEPITNGSYKMNWKMKPDCPPDQVVALRPMRAMREKCMDCCCGQTAMVRDCRITGPAAARAMSPEHKRKLLEGRARALAMRRPEAQT